MVRMKRLVLLLLLAASACGKGPSDDQCKKLLDHLVDLEFKKAGATATADSQKTDLAKQKPSRSVTRRSNYSAAITASATS